MTDAAQGTEGTNGIERTPQGDIKDQSPPQGDSPKVETSTAKEAPKPLESPLNAAPEKKEEPKKDEPKAGAPEAYTDFKLPEGFEANAELMTEYKTLAKAAGLSQEQAQGFVDYYSKISQQAADAPVQFWLDQQKTWQEEIKSDPQLGPRLGEVKANFSKMLDSLTQVEGATAEQVTAARKLVADFREAMDLTGAGNNPAFIRVMDALSKNFVEGAHVRGNGPSAAGQNRPGTGERPSHAQAIYGHLNQGG